MTGKIHPVILCGGGGTRLWPQSRRSYPKQFSTLIGENSLLHNTLTRFSGAGYHPPMMLTHEDFRFIVGEQLAQAGIADGRIIIEPQARNTAPAIAAAAMLLRNTPEAIMLVAPSDHLTDRAGFDQAVNAALPAVRDGKIVCFGVEPDHAATGYGYIETAGNGAIKQFVEKPAQEVADRMFASSCYLWNAGVFLFRVDTILAAFATHAPDILPYVSGAVEGATRDLDFLRLGASFADAPDISFDYAVMERAQNRHVVPIAGHWNDLGSWKTIWQESPRDANGVTGDGVAIDCSDTLLSNAGGQTQIVGIGLNNIAVVATADAVLVTDLDQTQKVGDAVRLMRKAGIAQADAFAREYRPWGWFETISKSGRYHVKRILVKPGGRLSLQSHKHRSEHWVIVQGVAQVTVGKTTKDVQQNQSLYVPLGAVHRLENTTRDDLVIIEVQVGDYLEEDDIVRYDDIYDRN